MSRRVLLITQWFDPEPTIKGLVFAKELVKQGFTVEVITGFPNYPGGKLYPGYKIKWIQKEVIDGIHVTRVPLYPSHDQSVKGRILNYVSFFVSSLIYGLFGAKKPHVIYAYHPPLTVGISAVLIRFFRRVPMVYDIQDMWPDTLNSTGMFSNKKALKIVSSLCNWVYKHTDQIVVLSPGFKRLLIERKVPENKIKVIYNWCAEDAIASPESTLPDIFPGKEKFKILFAGNMGKAQALESVLQSAEILQYSSPDIVFIFLGGGVELDKLKKIKMEKNLNNVVFMPSVPMSEVGNYLQSADVLLVHLRKDPLFSITIPSKTQAYMSVGKPILMAVDGDAADLIIKSQCGAIAESENPQSIANAARFLMDLSEEERRIMSENSRSFYKEKLSLKTGSSYFGDIFNKIRKK